MYQNYVLKRNKKQVFFEKRKDLNLKNSKAVTVAGIRSGVVEKAIRVKWRINQVVENETELKF